MMNVRRWGMGFDAFHLLTPVRPSFRRYLHDPSKSDVSVTDKKQSREEHNEGETSPKGATTTESKNIPGAILKLQNRDGMAHTDLDKIMNGNLEEIRAKVEAEMQKQSKTSTHEGKHQDHDHDSHHHSEPVNEPLGRAFYLILGVFPISIILYTISKTGDDGKVPVISRLIQKYSDHQEQWAARNKLHSSMVEQAAHDRHLFQTAQGQTHIELRTNELFNNGSPFNVVAGQQARGMDELVRHYERKNREQDDNRIQRMEMRKAREAARQQRS